MTYGDGRGLSTVVASLGRDLEEYCATINIDLAPIANAVGIDLAVFSDFSARVDLDAFCRILETCALLSKDNAFALNYADFFQSGGSGAFGQGLSKAPTVEHLFRFLATYLNAIVDHRHFEATFEQDAVTIEWSYSPLVSKHEQFVLFSVSSIISIFEHATNNRQRYKLFSFEQPRPADLARFRQAFPGPLRFGQDMNRVVFATELMKMDNPRSDPVAFDYMRQQCEFMLRQSREKKPLTTVLREDIIEALPAGGITVKEMARRNGMSVRTLQRRLAFANLTYEQLVDEVRMSSIETLLSDPNVTLARVAELTGYSDQSAFSRAVSKRYQKSPTQLRRDLLRAH